MGSWKNTDDIKKLLIFFLCFCIWAIILVIMAVLDIEGGTLSRSFESPVARLIVDLMVLYAI
jgi:hypothetical protein